MEAKMSEQATASAWEITGETWENVSDDHGVTVEDKWLKAKCRLCGVEVHHEAAWFGRKKNTCECVKAKVEVETPVPVRVREPITLTVRRVGVMAGRRRVKVTDENERRVAAHFTIPVGLIRKLGDRAARERKSASEVVTELVRGYLDGPTVDGEMRSGVEAGQEVDGREGGL